jgi:ketosteroid isomerase-like protein
MSRENVEIIRRAVAAYNERGLEGLREFAHPDIEWTTTGIFLEAGTYRGHDGIRQ